MDGNDRNLSLDQTGADGAIRGWNVVKSCEREGDGSENGLTEEEHGSRVNGAPF